MSTEQLVGTLVGLGVIASILIALGVISSGRRLDLHVDLSSAMIADPIVLLDTALTGFHERIVLEVRNDGSNSALPTKAWVEFRGAEGRIEFIERLNPTLFRPLNKHDTGRGTIDMAESHLRGVDWSRPARGCVQASRRKRPFTSPWTIIEGEG